MTAPAAPGPATSMAPTGKKQRKKCESPAAVRFGLISGLRHAIAPVLDNPATPARTRYLVNPILFPAEKPSPADAA
jgi:hypothetical protein